MPRKAGNSPKAEQDQLRDRMRALGCTVPQIAAEMSRRFNLRPRLAWRHALGWPQWKLAQAYNTAHPGATLSDSRISEYERWPHGGSPPSPRYLTRLAVAFGHGCTPTQLVDADDLEHFEPADRYLLTQAPPPPSLAVPTWDRAEPNQASGHQDAQPATLPSYQPATALVLPPGTGLVLPPGAGVLLPADAGGWAATLEGQLPGELAGLLRTCLELLTAQDGDALDTPHGQDRVYHRLVPFLTSWAHTMKRRRMLRSLGWAASIAALRHCLDPDEQHRVAAVLRHPGRIDTQTLNHFEAILWHCERQDDALGPRDVLDTVLDQRNFLRSLLPGCPASLRPRLLSTLSNASRLAGWFSFDLNDFDSAAYYYEDARTLAHDAENIELGAIILCGMSHSAVWQGKPRIGIDHAVAAGQWASRTDDLVLRAYCADITAKAYSSAGQRDACLLALDAAETTLASTGGQQSELVYFYGEGAHTLNCGQCHLKLGDAERAADYAQKSLATLDPSFTRLVAFTSVNLGRAYALSGEVEEATRLFGNAGEIAAHHSSARLIKAIQRGRAELQPWKDTSTVRELDDRLTTYGVA